MELKFKYYYLFLLLFAFSYFVCLDPKWHRFYTDTIAILKYFPVIITLPVLLKNKLQTFSLTFIIIPIIFFLMELSGGLYTIIILKNKIMDTFTGRALNMLVFFSSVVYFTYTSKTNIEEFLKKYMRLTMIFVYIYIVFSLFYLLMGRPAFLKNNASISRQLYHEELYYLIPAWIFFLKYRKRIVFFLSTMLGFISLKITGFILSILNLHYFLKIFAKKKLRVFSYSIISIFIFIVVFLYYSHGIDSMNKLINLRIRPQDFTLPTGNVAIRLKLYNIRIKEFFNSPLIGTIFIGNPNIHINKIYIPSHSDILDILAFSGIIGFSLFFIINAIALFKWKNNYFFLKKSISETISKGYLYSVLIIINGLITLCINPIILHPAISSFYWFWLGFNLAIIHRFNNNTNKQISLNRT